MKTLRILSVLLFTLSACSAQPVKKEKEIDKENVNTTPIEVRILAFNDLHGNIEGPTGSVIVDGKKTKAGGADFLSAKIAERKTENSIVVSAGDLIGASPLLSALFHDEPTIEAANKMGLELNAVGNHEFDEGVDELLRMQNGGCHPEDGCQDGDDFGGANFKFLAANVFKKSTGETLFPSTMVKEFGTVKVGFVGLTLEGTPAIVSPIGIKSVTFGNEIETINKAVSKFQSEGIETIVVLIHEGGYPTIDQGDRNECPNISGPILDIVKGSNSAVDVFVTGHTHKAYICDIEGRLVTSGKSYGRLLTEIDLKIDPKTQDVLKKSATNIVIDRSGYPDKNVEALIKKYETIVAPIAGKSVGSIVVDLPREADVNGVSLLGKMIADVQLWATKESNAQIAFMNSGGIRAPLMMAPLKGEGEGVVTYEEAHTSQPFGNGLVTMTLTGEQIKALLESQFSEGRNTILQPSKGFYYTWSASAALGNKVDPKSMKLHGSVIDMATKYRITVNGFLSEGGDGFKLLKEGSDRVGGPIDLDALVNYFSKMSPVKSSNEVRVLKVK